MDWCQNNTPPDLLIMDVMMAGGMDGLTAAALIKKEHPEVRIIIATSMADADLPDKAKGYGIDSFWFKSYSDISLL